VQTSVRYFFCAWLLVHAISGTTSARDLIATSDAVPPRLHVEIVFDGPPVAPMIEASAMKEAARIWAEYGVAVSTIEAGRYGGGDGAVGLTVTFTASPDPRPQGGTLGSIRFTDGVPAPAITMYPDAVAAIVASMRFTSAGARDRTLSASLAQPFTSRTDAGTAAGVRSRRAGSSRIQVVHRRGDEARVRGAGFPSRIDVGASRSHARSVIGVPFRRGRKV
jgi:hypothetical protein